MRKTFLPLLFSASCLCVASYGVDDELLRLREENLKLSLLWASQSEEPSLSFRLVNLEDGYPDPYQNYDSKNRQYYDGKVFPSPQPTLDKLKNEPGSEMKAWEATVEADWKEYKDAYEDWDFKRKRVERKSKKYLKENAVTVPEELQRPINSGEDGRGGDTEQETLELWPEFIEVTAENKPVENKKIRKENPNLQYLQWIKDLETERDAARGFFETIRDKLAIKYATQFKDTGEEKELIPLSEEELHKRVYADKTNFAVPYKTSLVSAQKKQKEKPVKAFVLKDSLDIRIETGMLSKLVAHLEREYEIFEDLLIKYKSDFAPRVNRTSWSGCKDWYQNTSSDGLKKQLQQHNEDYLPVNTYSQPTTDESVCLKYFRRDELGFKLREKYLSKIKRYQEVPLTNSNLFIQYYKGEDEAQEFNRGLLYSTTNTYKKSRSEFEQRKTRKFTNPIDTLFLKIFTRQRQGLDADVIIPMAIPWGDQMATEFVAPAAMGFHKNLWQKVMQQLRDTTSNAVLTYYSEENKDTHCKLYQRYKDVTQKISKILPPLQESAGWSLLPSLLQPLRLPSPFEFFFVPFQERPSVPRRTEIKLPDQGITDEDLRYRRVLAPYGEAPFVLESYDVVDLSNNKLKAPDPKTFRSSIRSLKVKGNHIGSLELLHGLPNLKYLDMSDQTFPASYGKKGMTLEPFGDGETLPHTAIEELYLRNAGLTDTDVVKAFNGFMALRVLDLSGNKLVKTSVNLMENLPQLQILNLANNKFTDILISVPERGTTFPRLKTLDISSNPLKNLHFLPLIPTLQVLIANDCGLQEAWGENFPSVKEGELSPCKEMKELHMKENTIAWTVGLDAHSGNLSKQLPDSETNNRTFNLYFPRLEVFEVSSWQTLTAGKGTPIKLSDVTLTPPSKK